MAKRKMTELKGLDAPDHLRLARILHSIAPKQATDQELVHMAAVRWDDLTDHHIGTVVTLAREIRNGRGS